MYYSLRIHVIIVYLFHCMIMLMLEYNNLHKFIRKFTVFKEIFVLSLSTQELVYQPIKNAIKIVLCIK